jgi:D-alanyl-D-alanine carboxypeptidase
MPLARIATSWTVRVLNLPAICGGCLLMLAVALALFLSITPLVPSEPPPILTETGGRPISSLATRLQAERAAVARDATGKAASIFGLPVADVRMLLLPVDRTRALPDGYRPPDLTWLGGRTVREIVKPDAIAMIEAAAGQSIELAPISGYRSPDEQALAFDAAVWTAMARGGEADRAEVEARMARFVAPPGHSQHQLGTAIDFSTWEINYALQPRFAETAAGSWLEQHAWQFGFVLSYTRQGEERSGYAYEPWHYRWVGRDLAAVLQRDGYLDHPTLIVDDYLRAAEELMAIEGVP